MARMTFGIDLHNRADVTLTSLGQEWAKLSKSPRFLAFGGVLARRKWIEEHGLTGAAEDAHFRRNRAEFL